jgi:hypothetical protein
MSNNLGNVLPVKNDIKVPLFRRLGIFYYKDEKSIWFYQLLCVFKIQSYEYSIVFYTQ